MKLMDEVKLQSSVEALEALCADFKDAPQWPAIRQNLQALRELLSDAGGVAPVHDLLGLFNLLDDVATWARQVAERQDVPSGVRYAADKIGRRAAVERDAFGVQEGQGKTFCRKDADGV